MPAANETTTAADRVAVLLERFKMTTAARELAPRLLSAGHDDAVVVLEEVLLLEAEGRLERRVARRRRASKLPAGKTLDSLDRSRVPRAVMRGIDELSRGHFLARGDNVLIFGQPGVGKSHLACALGHALVDRGQSVLFAPTYQLVQNLLAARRDLSLPRELRRLDTFDLIVLDDIGYVQQSADEAEVLFTLMAERYERRSLLITSNLVFSEWGRIFKSPMTTAAAIDRLVHHATILEVDRSSIRAEDAARHQKPPGKKGGAR